MSAARYWRAVGLQAVGGGALELSALHLYLAGARVDAVASLACTVAPASGALAALQDDDTDSAVRWLDVSAPGFALVWDFGAAQDVNALRLGAGALESEFLQALALQHSSDGAAWTTLTSIPAFAWPGAGAMQPAPGDGDPHFDKVSLLLHMDGADGSTTFTDSSPRPKTVTAVGDAKISTAQTLFGGSTGYFDGAGDALSVANSVDLDFGTGDFTIECWVYIAGNSAPDNDGNRVVAIVSPWGASDVSGYLLAINGSSSTTGTGINFDSWSAGNTTAGTFYRAATTITQGAWHHIAATVQAGVRRLFLDGVQLSATQSNFGAGYAGFETFGRPLCVGGTFQAQYPLRLNGHLKGLRLTKGAARYTADFTPPTAPFPDSLGGGAATPPAPRGIAQAPAIVLSGGASAPAGPVLAPAAITRDMQDGGGYCIYGTTELDADPTDVPVRRRVQLYNQRDGRLVRETWSDAATGAYRFDHIRGGDGTRYFVVAFDHTGDKRAVVADNLVPEVMT